MKGSRRCKNTKGVFRISLSSEEEAEEEEVEDLGREMNNMNLNSNDYEDLRNWNKDEPQTEEPKTEITIKQVATKKNIVQVKVGEANTEMYADSGADVNVAPHTWYRKEMGILQPCNLILSPYGTKEQLPVEGKFKTKITTKKGAQVDTWVHIVKADQHF